MVCLNRSFCFVFYPSIFALSVLCIVNLDDCWQRSRDASGTIQADPQAFPSGIPALADYIHSRTLKFGLYSGIFLIIYCLYIYMKRKLYYFFLYISDAGSKTCAGRPGSLHYETKDANTYASWKADYLKYDNCYTDGTTPEVRYPPMRDALNASGRPIFYSMCGMFVNI
jgi:alpha-galactosidase